MTAADLVSACCGKPVWVEGRTTHYYVCAGCDRDCDAVPAPAADGRAREVKILGRPCRYCLAAYPILFDTGEISACEFGHRDEQRVYDLATALARMVHGYRPSDEIVGWFLEDADAIVDDFDPVPPKWRLRKLPDAEGFIWRFRLNGVTYVVEPGGKGDSHPVRLSKLRQWQREADEAARARTVSHG